jgi:hypothetical protein
MRPLAAISSLDALDSSRTGHTTRPLVAPRAAVASWTLEPLGPLIAWWAGATSNANLPGLNVDLDAGVLVCTLRDLRKYESTQVTYVAKTAAEAEVLTVSMRTCFKRIFSLVRIFSMRPAKSSFEPAHPGVESSASCQHTLQSRKLAHSMTAAPCDCALAQPEHSTSARGFLRGWALSACSDT